MESVITNYEVGVQKLKDTVDRSKYEQYKFKDEGYLCLYYYRANNPSKHFHGFITSQQLRSLIGNKQWSKFCNKGKRVFKNANKQ